MFLFTLLEMKFYSKHFPKFCMTHPLMEESSRRSNTKADMKESKYMFLKL